MITYKNIFQHELIGLNVEIIESFNESLIGNKGIIIDETKYTFLIELENSSKVKRFIKNISVFKFDLENGDSVKINGDILVSRPEDRLKKKFRRI